MNDNQERPDYMTGEQLLANWTCTTREEQLERACLALLETVEHLHIDCKGQSLEDNLHNRDIFCSCADAYRMGKAALGAVR